MKNVDLTLALDGEVTLEDFSRAMQRFREIVVGLENEVAPGAHINWVIEDLKKKCAIAKIRGVATTRDDIASIGRVRRAYTELGRKAAQGEALTNTETVVQAVVGLRRLINGRVKAVRLESEKKTYVIKKTTIITPMRAHWDTETFGGARGRVQSISDRQYLHFTLYDYNDDRPITCSYPSGNRDRMRKIWGKLVYVEGIVTRDVDTDLVSSIRDISSIEVLKERKPHAWREALGCAK
jgi:hypothetical protein